MKNSRRQLRQQRVRVFLGSEGESERGYGVLLARILEESERRDVHIDNVCLGGGDPLSLIDESRKHLMNERRKGNTPYKYLGLLLDTDRLNQDNRRDKKAFQIAKEMNLRLIWQQPCHEAFILRHLPGCVNLKPRTTNDAMVKLLNKWPEYEKPMSAAGLRRRIDLKQVIQAGRVQSELQEFLDEISFYAHVASSTHSE